MDLKGEHMLVALLDSAIGSCHRLSAARLRLTVFIASAIAALSALLACSLLLVAHHARPAEQHTDAHNRPDMYAPTTHVHAQSMHLACAHINTSAIGEQSRVHLAAFNLALSIFLSFCEIAWLTAHSTQMLFHTPLICAHSRELVTDLATIPLTRPLLSPPVPVSCRLESNAQQQDSDARQQQDAGQQF